MGRGFFKRSPDGIHIPMDVLLPIEKTDLEIASESFLLGLKHIGFGFIHLLLVLALFLVFRGRAIFSKLLWFAFGQGFSLILIEFGVSGFDILFTELLILLLVCLENSITRIWSCMIGKLLRCGHKCLNSGLMV